jgi:hypothetical protein
MRRRRVQAIAGQERHDKLNGHGDNFKHTDHDNRFQSTRLIPQITRSLLS